MKHLILTIALVLGLSAQLFAQGTPRGMQMAQGVLGTVQGTIMGISGIKNLNVPEPTGYTKALGIAELTGATASLYLAEESVRNAGKMDTEKGNAAADVNNALNNNGNFDGNGNGTGIDIDSLFPCGISNPTCNNNSGNTTNNNNTNTDNTLDTVDADKLLNIIAEKKAFVQQGLDKATADLAAEGISAKELLENPEKFMSAKEAQKFKAETAQSAPDLLGKDAQVELDKLLASDSATSEDYTGSSNFRTIASEGGVFADLPEMPKFDMDSLFASQFKKGKENSAPGYYGNVPLKVLNPNSKQSLFERVSLKLKKLM